MKVTCVEKYNLSDIEINVINHIKPKDMTICQYVNKFYRNKPQELHDFLYEEMEFLYLSGGVK